MHSGTLEPVELPARVSRGDRLDDAARVVGGAVVDDDDLQVRDRLGEDALERLADGVGMVAVDHQDADEGLALAGAQGCAQGALRSPACDVRPHYRCLT